MTARYFLLRRVRFGPLVPARLVEIAHEPGEPDNIRDRWPPFVTCADIAGEVVPPEELTDRFFWSKSHWKWAEPVDEATYRYHFDRLRRAETHDPTAPVLRSQKRVRPEDVPLPSFERENQL
jgi:hypothetical protein